MIHLLYGYDAYRVRMRVKQLIDILPEDGFANLNRAVFPPDAPLKEVVNHLRTPGFMGERVAIIEDPKWLKGKDDLSPLLGLDGLLIIQATSLDGRLKCVKQIKKAAQCQEFKAVAPWDTRGLRQLVNDLTGYQGGIADVLIDLVGSDSARLVSEAAKLRLHENLTPALARELIDPCNTSALDLVSTLLTQNLDGSLQLLATLLVAKEPALRILAVLIRQLHLRLSVSVLSALPDKDIAASCGCNPYRVKHLRREVARIPQSTLQTLVGALLAAEVAFKSGGGDSVLERAIIKGLQGVKPVKPRQYSYTIRARTDFRVGDRVWYASWECFCEVTGVDGSQVALTSDEGHRYGAPPWALQRAANA